jgi:hypothetical protein
MNEDGMKTVSVLAPISELLFDSRLQVVHLFVEFYSETAKEQDILSTCFLRSFSYKPNPWSNSVGMLPFNPDAENRSKKFRAMDNISNGFNGNSPF